MATLSQAGFELLKGFEGFKLKPYKATKSEKYWTVGLGHYGPDVNPNKIYTEAECQALFAKDKVKFENDVNKVWHEGMSQQMFDALFSMAYNHGNVSRTVLKNACSGEGWRDENKIRGIWQSLYTVNGLLSNRRRKEVNYFFGTSDTGGEYSSGGSSGSMSSDVYAGSSGNYGSSSSSSFSTGSAGGYSAGGQNNSFASYSAENPGQTLSMEDTASFRMKDVDKTTKHTRIYKTYNPSITVDELSMAIDEGTIKDSSSGTTNQTT